MSVRSKLRKQYAYANTIATTRGRKAESVKRYTGEEFDPLNKCLLHKTALDRSCRDIMEDLDSLFKTVPPVEEEFVVYRGVTKKHNFGVLSGFISTSYDYQTALEFADKQNQCCILIIKVPVGAKVLPIEELSVNPKEGEILLPRSGYFVATGVSYKGGMEHINLELILESSTKDSL